MTKDQTIEPSSHNENLSTFINLGRLIDDGMIICASDGSIISANRPAFDLFEESLTGQRLQDVLHSHEAQQAVSDLGDALRPATFNYRHNNKVQREFQVRIGKINDGYFGVILQDLTLRRNLEKVRRDFVANVSHELRSPLTSLVGFVETMQTNPGLGPEQAGKFLSIMDEEAKRMSRLIDDLLSLSQVEVEEHIIPSEKVPVVQILNAVNDSLVARAASRDIRITLDDRRPAPNDRLIMLGESDEITEVFHNLVENAVKYAFENSEIIVRLSQEDDRQFRVDVINHGEGIAAKHLPRLTERFYRVDKARSRQMGGTGLGLAIVKHIVNRHRGVMHIRSDLGKTTTFSVTFPAI